MSAFSMNWKPDLDEMAKEREAVVREAMSGHPSAGAPRMDGAAPSRTLGPIPGILPPRREEPTQPRSERNNVAPYSFNLNWRPPPVDDKESPARPIPAPTSSNAAVPDRDPRQRRFRASLCATSLEVTCLADGGALSCTSPSGMVCCLERMADSRWGVQIHPSRARLSREETHDMARALYACAYAVMASPHQPGYIQLEHADKSTNLENALAIFGPPADLSMSITSSVVLQLFALADARLACVPAPYVATTSFRSGIQPTSHPLRVPVPQGELYSRWDASISDYVVLTGSREKHQLEITAGPRGQRPDTENVLTARVDWLPEASGVAGQESDDYDRGEQCCRYTGVCCLAEAPSPPELVVEAISEKHDDEIQRACLKSLVHYLLIDEPRTRRIVCSIPAKAKSEPSVKAILAGLGFQPESGVENKYTLRRNAFWQRVSSL